MEFNAQPAPERNNHAESWQEVKKDVGTNLWVFGTNNKLEALYLNVLNVVTELIVLKEGCFFTEAQKKFIQLCDERNEFGRAKYGTPLQPFNGRDSLQDSLEEALDLAVYLKTALLERK